MVDWKPIPAEALGKRIAQGVGGFWVVAIVGRNVIWYNDVEEGFDLLRLRKKARTVP